MSNKKHKASLNKLLYNKKIMFPVSVLIALLFWVLITITQNPTRDIVISNVPVTLNTEDTVISELGLGVVGEYQDEVTVKVSGPSYIVSSLKTNDIMVTASLANVKSAGTYSLELTASRAGTTSGYSIISVKPSKIEVTFDAFDTSTFNIVAVANGVSAVKGLVAESAIVTESERSEITVTGPHSKMEKIAEVRAVADVNKTLKETKSFNADLKFYDINGNELDNKNLSYENQPVKITVPISKKKTLKVVPEFSNLPNYYFENSLSYTLSENTITVIGPPETVDKMQSVSLESIDFSNITSNKNSFDVSLNLPNGIKSVENIEYITVKLNLGKISKKTVLVKNIVAENLSSNLKAELVTDVQVTLCGSKKELKKFNSKNVYITVDVSEKSKGDYTLDATVSLKNASKVWAVGKYQATVTLK